MKKQNEHAQEGTKEMAKQSNAIPPLTKQKPQHGEKAAGACPTEEKASISKLPEAFAAREGK